MIQKHMKSLICGKDLNFSLNKSLDDFNSSTLILLEYMWKHVSMLHVAVSHPQVWEWSSNSVYLCVGVCSHASIGVWGREGRNSFCTNSDFLLSSCLSICGTLSNHIFNFHFSQTDRNMSDHVKYVQKHSQQGEFLKQKSSLSMLNRVLHNAVKFCVIMCD